MHLCDETNELLLNKYDDYRVVVHTIQSKPPSKYNFLQFHRSSFTVFLWLLDRRIVASSHVYFTPCFTHSLHIIVCIYFAC